MIMIKKTINSLFLLLPILALAQSPGGITSTVAWYKADGLLYSDAGVSIASDNGSIYQWNDHLGSGRNLIQATSARRPIYSNSTTLANFNPTVTFTRGNANWMQCDPGNGSEMINRASGTFYAAGYMNINYLGTNLGAGLIGFNADMDYPGLHTSNNTFFNLLMYAENGTNYTPISTNAFTYKNSFVAGSSWQNNASTTTPASYGAATISLNGVHTFYSGNNFRNVDLTNAARVFRIGGDTDWGSHDGQLNEVLIYQNILTTAEKNRLESYLAIKYGTTLTGSYVNSTNGNVWSSDLAYKNNIFGIARDDNGALHQKQSRSENGNQKLIIGNASSLFNTNAANTNNLINGQYLLVGDNGLSQALSDPLSNLSAPGGATNKRFSAIWKVKNTNAVGTITVAWPKGISNLHLVKSGDATFDASDSFIPMTTEITVNGTVFNMATVSFNDGDYFTLAGFVITPGGVTGTDFWVKSDDAGNIATAWKDHSANADNIPAVGAWALSSADRAHNFHPYTTGYTASKLFYNPSSLINGAGNSGPLSHSIISAVRTLSGGTGRITGIDDDVTYAAEPAVSINAGSPSYYKFFNGTMTNNFSTAFPSASNVFSTVSDNGSAVGGGSSNAGGEQRLGLNGTYELKNDFDSGNRFQLFDRKLRIGHGGWTATGPFPGDIMEIIWYKRALTTNEQSRVNTYLALKNGVTLAEDYLASNNDVIWNRTANAGYNTNVFGLARDNTSGLHQKQAASTVSGQKLVIGHATSLFNSNEANTNSLTEGQFLIAGDNGLKQALVTPMSNSTAPGGETNFRFESIWKVQNTSSVGQVIVAWPKGLTNLHLVKSSGNATFDNSDTFIPMTSETTINGVVYNTATVTLNNGDYFTFAGYAHAPAGVVNALSYWYRADKNTTNSGAGTDVTSWTDFFSGTVSSQLGTIPLPKYAEGTASYFNFNPGINFTATAQALGNFSVQTLNSLNYDVFTFVKEGASTGNQNRILSIGYNNTDGGGGNFDSPGIAANGYVTRRTNTGGGSYGPWRPGTATSTAIPSITYNTFTNTDFKRAINGEANSTSQANNAIGQTTGGHIFGTNDGSWALDGDDPGFIGHMGEAIIYGSGNLSLTERRRIDSYLAIKYGITLGRVATDHYLGSTASANSIVWNGASNVAYNNNVFGIARADIGGFEQKVSKSVNSGTILTVAKNNDFTSSNLASGRTALPNNESYLIFGDNNDVSAVTYTPTEIGDCGELIGSETNIKLIPRKWMVQRTNKIGATYLQVNFAAYTSSINTDVKMFVADDANFTQNVVMVSGVKNGSNWTFSHNFDNENANRYITFGGTFAAAACEQCKGGTYNLRTGYQWNQGQWANQTANSKTNILLGNDANGNPLYASMYADYSENPSIEYVPTRYPAQYGGKWTASRRYDNTNAKARHRIELTQAMKASFQISNINTFQNNKNNFEVVGYCNGVAVLPKITYAYNTSYHTFTIEDNKAIGSMSWRGLIPNVSTANVRFDRPVDRIEIICSVDRVNATKTLRSMLYSDMTLECAEVLEPTPDNVYVSHGFTQETLATCGGETTMRIKVTNNNLCEDKTIDLHQLLPSGLTYVPNSFNGNDLPAGTMNTATLTYSGSSFELTGLTLPRGEHWMYVDIANPGTAGTYPTQFTFEVTDGLDPNQVYSSSTANLNYYESLEPSPAAPTSTLSIKNNVTCGENAIQVTYRMKIDNPNATSITGAEIMHMFDYDQVIQSVVFVSGEDEDGLITGNYPLDGSNSPIEPVGNNVFNLVDATLPVGVSYIDITVNVGNSYSIAEVQALGISSSFLVVFGSGECAGSAESLSNEIILPMCSPCAKPGTTGTPLSSSAGIRTKGDNSVANWPQSVPNGYLVLDGAFKGMVITHMSTAEIEALTPLKGMLVFDTDLQCVKLYRGAGANAPLVNPTRQGWVCIERICID